MRNIPLQVYWDDPNLKLLHVAALLSEALRKTGKNDASHRILADTLVLRSQRHKEDSKQHDTSVDPEYTPCISRKERTIVIAFCLKLFNYDGANQSKPDNNIWLAQAYVESVKLSRAKDIWSGQPLFPETLSDITLSNCLQYLGHVFLLTLNICSIESRDAIHPGC